MKLLHLLADGCRGLPDRAFSFAHPTSGAPLDVVLVTGGPASGKTSLLDAIIAAKEDVARYGPDRGPSWSLRRGVVSARVTATWRLSAEEVARGGGGAETVRSISVFGEGAPPLALHEGALKKILGSYESDPALGKFEYFEAERALPATAVQSLGGEERDLAFQRRLRLTSSPEKHRGIRRFVLDAIAGEALGVAGTRAPGAGKLAQLRHLLAPFIPGRTFDGVDRPGREYRVRFVGPDGHVADVDELSASERQGVLFAVTFLRFGINHSIVLIDTPEQHLHPDDHVAFLLAVAALGKDNQIIAATTSAELLGWASPEQIIDLGGQRRTAHPAGVRAVSSPPAAMAPSASAGPARATDSRFLSTVAQPWREEAAAVGRDLGPPASHPVAPPSTREADEETLLPCPSAAGPLAAALPFAPPLRLER